MGRRQRRRTSKRRGRRRGERRRRLPAPTPYSRSAWMEARRSL